jgi:hypothetical protein
MDEQKYMEDAQGRLVPVEMVKEIDKLRDQTVREIMAQTFAMRDTPAEFKRRVWSDIQAFLSVSAEQHGVAFGGKKGNITITSFDGRYKLLVAVNDILRFNEQSRIAKALIDACISGGLTGRALKSKRLLTMRFMLTRPAT